MWLLLLGALGSFTTHGALSQESSADGVSWNRKFELSDGRLFVTDGSFTLDASFVDPREVEAAELIGVSATTIEGFLSADLPDEFSLSDLDRGTRDRTYLAPSGVTLAARYVEYLQEALPSSSLRLRMQGDLQPVVILSDGKAVGLVMPMARVAP